jgi:hypothetical protein
MAINWLQLLMVGLLVAGAVLGWPALSLLAAGLAVLACALQWRQLIRLARVFLVLAALAALLVAWYSPGQWPALLASLQQGAAFAALMMVLGMLRHPVRRSPFVRAAAQYLLVYPPRSRYAVANVGAHFLSLLFNVGVIAMIGDLTHAKDGQRDAASSAMVVAAMRGAALVSIWSPIGLGFAIVTAGIPALEPLQFLLAALGFTLLALWVTALWPMLPPAAQVAADQPPPTARPSVMPLLGTLAICLLLLLLVLATHGVLAISFTLASVAVVPLLAVVWLLLEGGAEHRDVKADLCTTFDGLSSLRSESAIFLAANVIGSALSILVQALPFWHGLAGNAFPVLPVLLLCLAVIPLIAASYIPNSIVVVMAAQLLGNSPLGQHYPLALGLTLAIAWGVAISVSPISAMCLITAQLCGISSRAAALVWNRPFALVLLALAAVSVSLLVLAGP